MPQPPHVQLDNQYYFITGRTRDGAEFFSSHQAKVMLRDCIFEVMRQFDVRLCGWVVLSNHYHILVYIRLSHVVPKIMQAIHGRSSRRIRKKNLEGRLISLPSGRGVWCNYWDRCIRDESDYHTHLNYIHYNPVKHSLVKNMHDYAHSSSRWYLQNCGSDWLEDCFRQYQIVDFTP